MADHFKLEITNRSVRITTFTNVSEDFADEYYNSLSGVNNDETETAELDFENMTDAMRAVFAKPANTEAGESDVTKNKEKVKKSKKEFRGRYTRYNYKKRIKMRTEKFRMNAYMNFRVPNVQFVTLTFDPREFPNAKNLNACHLAFRKFIKRLHYVLEDFVYIAVFSRQKNGNWHYHMLCNLDINVKNKLIQDKWGYGLTHSTPLTSYTEFDSRISYCIDNMYAVAWEDLQGENGYLASKGLLKKVVFRSWKEDEVDSAYEYLSKILDSTDKPLDLTSRLIEENPNNGEKSFISHKISHKVFNEFFKDVKIAKMKK